MDIQAVMPARFSTRSHRFEAIGSSGLRLDGGPACTGEPHQAASLFLGDASHVMLYAGSDSLLESLRSAGIAERTSFRERFHKPLSEIESGDAVTDYGFNKPAKRRIFFGSFLHD